MSYSDRRGKKPLEPMMEELNYAQRVLGFVVMGWFFLALIIVITLLVLLALGVDMKEAFRGG